MIALLQGKKDDQAFEAALKLTNKDTNDMDILEEQVGISKDKIRDRISSWAIGQLLSTKDQRCIEILNQVGFQNISLSHGAKLLKVIQDLCTEVQPQLLLQLLSQLFECSTDPTDIPQFGLYKPPMDTFISFLNKVLDHSTALAPLSLRIFRELQRNAGNPRKVFSTLTNRGVLIRLIEYREENEFAKDSIDEIMTDGLLHKDHLEGYPSALTAIEKWSRATESEQDPEQEQPQKRQKQSNKKKSKFVSYQSSIFKCLDEWFQPGTNGKAFLGFTRHLLETYATLVRSAASASRKRKHTATPSVFLFWLQFADLVMSKVEKTQDRVAMIETISGLCQMLPELDIYRVADDSNAQRHLECLKNISDRMIELYTVQWKEIESIRVQLDTFIAFFRSAPQLLLPRVPEILNLCLSRDELSQSTTVGVVIIETYSSLRVMEELMTVLVGISSEENSSMIKWMTQPEIHQALQQAFRAVPQGQIVSFWQFFSFRLDKDVALVTVELFQVFSNSCMVNNVTCDIIQPELVNLMAKLTQITPSISESLCSLWYYVVRFKNSTQSWIRLTESDLAQPLDALRSIVESVNHISKRHLSYLYLAYLGLETPLKLLDTLVDRMLPTIFDSAIEMSDFNLLVANLQRISAISTIDQASIVVKHICAHTALLNKLFAEAAMYEMPIIRNVLLQTLLDQISSELNANVQNTDSFPTLELQDSVQKLLRLPLAYLTSAGFREAVVVLIYLLKLSPMEKTESLVLSITEWIFRSAFTDHRSTLRLVLESNPLLGWFEDNMAIHLEKKTIRDCYTVLIQLSTSSALEEIIGKQSHDQISIYLEALGKEKSPDVISSLIEQVDPTTVETPQLFAALLHQKQTNGLDISSLLKRSHDRIVEKTDEERWGRVVAAVAACDTVLSDKDVDLILNCALRLPSVSIIKYLIVRVNEKQFESIYKTLFCAIDGSRDKSAVEILTEVVSCRLKPAFATERLIAERARILQLLAQCTVRSHLNVDGDFIRSVLQQIYIWQGKLELGALTLAQVHSVLLCMNPVYRITLVDPTIRFDDLHSLFMISCMILSRILQNSAKHLHEIAPMFCHCIRSLMHLLFRCSEHHSEAQLLPWAMILSRLCSSFSNHVAPLRRHAVYVLSSYFNLAKRGLTCVYLDTMRNGIFGIFDVCSDHEFAQLHTVLDSAARTFFTSAHQRYKNTHKYLGQS